MQWGNIEAVLDEEDRLHVVDPQHGISEQIEFANRVVNMSMSYGNIVVCTASKCFIYSLTQQNWASPFVFDVKDCVMMIV